MESVRRFQSHLGIVECCIEVGIPRCHLRKGGTGGVKIIDRPVTSSTGRWAPWERGAVGTLLHLAKKSGGLSLLRRCSECSHWFHANRPHQQFCGELLNARRHKAQDPEFKAQRAAYMREKYEL